MPTPIRPPTPRTPPAQDTARYVAWMEQRGKPITDQAREDVALRIGDWGFFDHGHGPGQFFDRAGLDRSGHAIQPTKAVSTGDWHAFLTTPGLDAAGALKRFAWLTGSSSVGPADAKGIIDGQKVTAPTLGTAADGTATLQGWVVSPPNMTIATRITITATATASTLVYETAKKL